MAAIAVETELGFEDRLRAVPKRPAVLGLEGRPVDEQEPATNGDLEPCELHSELVLVCPEVRERARELLPERDPDAFLVTLRQPLSPEATGADAVAIAPNLPVAVVSYALWRLAETARSALVAVAAVVALALLAEVLH